MPMQAFWIVFLESLAETETVLQAYELAEEKTFAKYGRRRFGSYESFKVCKHRFYQVKIKKTG